MRLLPTLTRSLSVILLVIQPWPLHRMTQGEDGRVGAQPFLFTRLTAHWTDYGRPDYLNFLEDARVEVAQVGFYGGHFWSLAHTDSFSGYPAHFPEQGLEEMGDWFERLNGQLHARGIRVVGHFNVTFLVGDPEGPDGARGFFKFYRDLWDETRLGPKPVENPLDLLEKNADGSPIVQQSYAIGGMKEYWGCLRNPAWRHVLKQWVTQAVRRGVDGLIANYFYRHNCVCEHCQLGFKRYLELRFTPEQLREQFQIDDLARHRFPEIVAWHAPGESTPLRREMLRYSQISNKAAFDEIFLQHGRSLKPDLIVAQWNHLGDFSQIDGDERCLLPAELWGKDETYAWYSTGDAANRTDLKQQMLGEATLQARYIRGALADRPFTLGKYEATRIRVAIAELAANGGAPMGFYTNFTVETTREAIVQYYRFLAKHDAIFRDCRAYEEVTLLFPRRAVHEGRIEEVARFRALGRRLLDHHVLFGIVPDDDVASIAARSDTQLMIDASQDADERIASWPDDVSRVAAPTTVRISASLPAGSTKEIDLHFVNYNRQELPAGDDGKPAIGAGAHDERPIRVRGVRAELKLPMNSKLKEVWFLVPEREEAQRLTAQEDSGRVSIELPEFLVYAVVQVMLQ